MKEQRITNYCDACLRRLEESFKVDIGAPACCGTSSTTSVSSYDRSISDSSDTSVDVNFLRENLEGFSAESSPNSHDSHISGLVNSMNNNDSVEDSLKSSHSSNSLVVQHVNESASDQIEYANGNPLSDDERVRSLLWLPPEADNPDDDVDGSLGINDVEDDDYVDGMKWDTPSSLSDERVGVLRVQERKNKFEELKNGKFMTYISKFLRNEVADMTETDAKSWLETIVPLSWEAALFLKPDSIKEATMDPDGYVKVKCIATGHRNESQLVKGLVFNKNVAHKHMITKVKNPRVLLIRGNLGQSSSVLSSFTSMDQENENVKTLMELIERANPNLVFVEKSVSRDIQEAMLAKGITLVYDMKLHRLERIARCTGSQIFSSQSLTIQNLRSCDSFHIEKFVEEHTLFSEGGKKPSKTLLFVEGCDTHLGCTILLKGSHSEQLKRIKNVVLHAAIAAFQLIVETSFVLDSDAMFSSVVYRNDKTVSQASGVDNFASAEEFATETEIPVFDGPMVEETDDVLTKSNVDSGEDFGLFTEPYNPAILSGLSSISTSLEKVFGANFPRSSSYFGSLSSFLRVKPTHTNAEDLQCSNSIEESGESEIKIQDGSFIEDLQGDTSMVTCSPSSEKHSIGKVVNHAVDDKEDGLSFMKSPNILVLNSVRNALRSTICEPSRFSHIMFYRNLDFPLIEFLHEHMFNQKRLCTTCGETPEPHVYYYGHHDKQLMIRIQRLVKHLPRNSERKIWMWIRCGKCKLECEVPICSKRVLVSALGGNLSFGRFMELSFSLASSTGMRPKCGHSLTDDFLYFFGEGPIAAIMKYSAVPTYTVSLPPTKLEFRKFVGDRIWPFEIKSVYEKGIHLFNAIGDSLKALDGHCFVSNQKRLPSIAELLKHEVSVFESNLRYVGTLGTIGKASCVPLILNWVVWGLLLRAYVWTLRLHIIQVARKECSPKINCVSCEGKKSSGINDGLKRTVEPAVQSEDIPVSGSSQIHEDKLGIFSDENHTEHFGHVGSEHSSSDEITTSASDDSTTQLGLESINGSKDWLWKPSTEIQRIIMNDLQQGLWPKFLLPDGNMQICFVAQQFISEEGARIHVPLDCESHIVRDHDGEHSSVIACALAYLKGFSSTGSCNTAMKENGFLSISSTNSQTLLRIPSKILPDGTHGSISDADSLTSIMSVPMESLVPVENHSPEVNLGVTKAFPKGKYSVICLFAKQFSELRSRCCPSELDYIASLSRCKYWDAKGGKSKSAFSKTHDDRFIIKGIKKIEFDSFLKFAPHYFNYMKRSYETGSQSCLAKVLGIYQVIIRPSKVGKETRHDLMVMENLSYGRKVTRQYDLKGALHARFTSATDNETNVLLDQNFVNDMTYSPLYVSKKTKHLLERAVWNDTCFLNSINVMDYSLLVGVDSHNRVLNCGIIDYLRQYTWDKQLETWVKSSLVVPKNVLPTVISPIEYKKRFRKFISKHFLSIPDDWCTENSPSSCDLCGCKIDSSTKSKPVS